MPERDLPLSTKSKIEMQASSSCFNKLTRPTAEPFYGMAVFTFAFNAFTVPQLVQHKVCRNMYNATVCGNFGKDNHLQNQVQEEAARWMALLPLSSLLPGFFMVLIIGPLSDAFGKKRLMILPPLIYFIQSVIFIVLCSLKQAFSPAFFFIPACLAGIFGENAGTTLLSVAYIADVSRREDRTFRLTVLESAIFIGTLSAALGSGAVINWFGFIGAFTTTAIVNALNFFYVVLLLPSETSRQYASQAEEMGNQDYGSRHETVQSNVLESSSHQERQQQSWKELMSSLKVSLNLRGILIRLKNALCKNRKTSKIIFILLVLLAVALIINMGEVYMGVLYLKHSPLNMTSIEIGYFASTAYALRAAGVVIIPYIFQRFFKFRDTDLVILAFAIQVIFFLGIGLAVNQLMMYLMQIIGMGIVIHLPVLRSMISKLVDEDQHGAVIAAAEAVDIGSSLLTSFLSNIIYSATVSLFSGFAVCVLSMVAFVGLIGTISFRLAFKDFHKDNFRPFQDEETVLLYDNKIGKPSSTDTTE